MQTLSIKQALVLIVSVWVLGGCAAKPVAEEKIVFPPPPDIPRLEWIGTFQSERDFKRTGADKLLYEFTGSSAELDAFDGPVGVTVNTDGRILVSDLYQQSLMTLDLENKDISYFLQKAFRNSLGVATDASGFIYVADGKAGKILVYDKDGAPMRAIMHSDLSKPSYLTVNDSLSYLYVSDPVNHDVKVFSLDGDLVTVFGGRGNGDGQFNAPQGVAVAPDGRVFVADMLNARIQSFTADGEYLASFGARGTLKNQFETPKSLSFDSDGNLYVVDSRRPNFRIFRPDGTLLLVVGGEKRTTHKLGFALPVAIYVDQFDRVFIVDLMNHRVAVWQYLSEKYRARIAAGEGGAERW